MRGTIWKDANLSRANLFGSFAKGADFSGADLTNADLEVGFRQTCQPTAWYPQA